MRLGWTAAVTLLSASVPLWGQESPLPDLFSDVIDVRVVNIEVVVTDRKGNRIRGLEAKDFELLVDGEPVSIEYFTEIDDRRALATSRDGVGVPSLAPDEPVGTSYLIFIDDLSAIQQHRNRVLTRLENDLALLGPADRVAIVAYDGRNVTRITDWTNSRQGIQHALEQARQRRALGLMDMAGLGNKTHRALMAATASLRSFADAPGRKVALLLIERWATQTDQWQPWSAWASQYILLQGRYAPLVNAANLVGYSLYPVDLPGLEGGSFRARTAERRWHDVLQYLADQTGGLPMLNSFSKKALAQTAEDTRSYYWLGFEPPRNEDDEVRDIRIRVAGRHGLRVRSRESFPDMSRGAEVTMLVEGSLLFGESPGADSLEVHFGTPKKAGFRKLSWPMEVTIPLDDLALLPVGELWMTELEFRIALIDRFGDRSETPISKIPIAGPTEPQPGDIFVYETDLLMRKRPHRYVAAVYDPLSGEILSATGSVGADNGTLTGAGGAK